MKIQSKAVFRAKTLGLTAVISAFTLALSSCAGGVGSSTAAGGAGVKGFEYGATQDEINKIVEDLEPVTIKFQPSATSPNSVLADAATGWADEIKRRSNGKITVDIVWGQAIASYSEIYHALNDGRVDIAYALPSYKASDFPEMATIAGVLGTLPTSPFAGHLVGQAVATELGWSFPEILERYEAKGLVPLAPLTPGGSYYTMCSKPTETLDKMQGKQIRAGTSAQAGQIQHLNASPVSLELNEIYEALQRKTIDCSIDQLTSAGQSGNFEVAPHVSYGTEGSFARAAGAFLGGSGFKKLPLPYRQIIFDSRSHGIAGDMTSALNGNSDGIRQIKKYGGTFSPFADDFQEAIVDANQELVQKADESLPGEDSIAQRIDELTQKWTARVEELGYTDKGSVDSLDEWYDPNTDFLDFGIALFEEGQSLAHRPT